jgi:hypothetical protein
VTVRKGLRERLILVNVFYKLGDRSTSRGTRGARTAFWRRTTGVAEALFDREVGSAACGPARSLDHAIEELFLPTGKVN